MPEPDENETGTNSFRLETISGFRWVDEYGKLSAIPFVTMCTLAKVVKPTVLIEMELIWTNMFAVMTEHASTGRTIAECQGAPISALVTIAPTIPHRASPKREW